MKPHIKCIRVLPYGKEDEMPLCKHGSCTCAVLPDEDYCPTCEEELN